jgi:hypothetical protein
VGSACSQHNSFWMLHEDIGGQIWELVVYTSALLCSQRHASTADVHVRTSTHMDYGGVSEA